MFLSSALEEFGGARLLDRCIVPARRRFALMPQLDGQCGEQSQVGIDGDRGEGAPEVLEPEPHSRHLFDLRLDLGEVVCRVDPDRTRGARGGL